MGKIFPLQTSWYQSWSPSEAALSLWDFEAAMPVFDDLLAGDNLSHSQTIGVKDDWGQSTKRV